MKLNFKRLMAMLLSVMMVVSMLPTVVFATETDSTESNVTYVAEVDGTSYETFAAALADANGETIKLLDAVSVASATIDGDVTIDLNGQTLTLTPAIQGYGLTVNGMLTIDGVGTVAVEPTMMGVGIQVAESGKLIVDGGDFTFSGIGNIASVSGEIVVNGGSFTGVASSTSIFNTGANAKITITGGTFSHTPIAVREDDTRTISISGGSGYTGSFDDAWLAEGYELDENGDVVVAAPAVTYVAQIGDIYYTDINEAFADAGATDTIVLLADATPALTSQRAITAAATIDLGGKTLTLTEDDLYFGTTTFKDGKIVVDPSVVASTAVFWMFENQTLTFDNVEIVATGVTGTYLIGINGGTGTAINLTNGSKITIANTSTAGLTAVIADNGTGNSVVIDNSTINVANIEGRFYLGGTNGNVTVDDSTINANGVKEGFYLRAGQTLAIEGTSNVAITLNTTEGRYGINLTDLSATYTKAETATVNASVYEPTPAAPTGSLGVMYVEQTDRARVFGEAAGIYANESVVVKLYSNGTLIGTTTRIGVPFPYESSALTINIVMAGEPSSSWNTVWENGAPSAYAIPDKAELVIDDQVMATVDVKLHGPDGKAPVVAAVTDDNGNITKFISNTDYSTDFTAVLNTALANGGNIVLMRDVVLTDTLTVPSGVTVTLDLNGKTVSQSKECTESYSMIENNGSLTITGNGKISFTDTSAGDPTFGWGSYTIRNAGTLVVENGTVEHLGAQNPGNGAANVHMYCAIYQYSGSTTINGGTISTPTYRSMRLWMGTMTINGGEIDGQVWVQTVSGEGATLNITGGSFSPNGNDGSSVYVTNDNNTVSFSVTGGTFATKIGCYNADTLTGNKITGGTFSEAAVTAMGTDSALLGDGMTFTQNESGSYGVALAPAEESWYDATATELVIDTPAELQEFAQITNGTHATIAKDTFSGKTVKLGADIDLSGITWTPIASFAGTFDGNNYTISNFKLDSTNADAGFFAYIGKYPATAKNLTLANVEAIAGANELGILAATAHTTVVNNVTIKNVKVTTENSNARVGGFFGYFNWTSAANSKLVNFEVDATMGAEFIGGYASFMDQNDDVGINNVDIEGFKVIVSDTDGNCEVGGFTGQTQTGWRDPLFQNCDVTGIDITATGTVTVGGFVANPGAHTRATNCTTEGKINATGVTDPSNYIGGFFGNAGWNDDLGSQGGHKLTNCSADVDIITGGAAAGGFIGSATNDNNANMPIAFTECEAKGTITVADGATANIGGFAGEADRGTYTDCTAAQTPLIGGTPTNVEIESTSWYDAEATELIIDTPEELAEFAQIVNGTHATFAQDTFTGKTVKLGADIDLSSVANWTPIGNSANCFWGTFDGDNHTISNITINVNDSANNKHVGFFGAVKKATLKNFTLTNVNIDVVGAKAYVGAVMGMAHSNSESHTTANLNFENITVDGCTINAESASGSAYVGGFVGYCYPANMTNISVSDLTLNPKATGSVFAGGLVGYMQGQNISNNGNTRAYYTVDTFNLNNITIKSTTRDSLIGGFAGYTYYGYITLKNATIDGFKVEADVTDSALVGGLIGLAHRSDKGNTFTNVEITGIDFDVTSDSGYDVILGGMVGYSGSPITYSDCSASGTITETTRSATSSAFVGGFAGQVASWSPSFEDCSADVTIEASSNYVGGFAGCVSTNSTYTDCSATMDPFIGYYYSGTLTNNGSYVASVGTEYYANFANAIAAANATEGGATVTLLADVVLSEMLTITGTVTLDLNGKTITGTDNTEKNFGLISVNKGNLTVNDSVGTGKITLTATVDSDWSRYSAVIANNQGTVTVTGGTIEHLGGTDMAYGIDNLTNGTIGDAALTVTGGTVKSTYRGIRMFANSNTCTNTLTITGGTVEGTNKGVWLQSANVKANIANLTINGTASVNSVYVWAPESGDASKLTMEANAANVSEVVDSLPEGYAIKNNDGVYGIGIVEVTYVAQIGQEKYTSIQKAIDAAADNATITLLSDVKLETTTKTSGDLDVYLNVAGKSITLDMNGKTISVEHLSTTDRIYAVICVEDGASLTVTGEGKIDATVDATTPKLAYMFLKTGSNGTLTIENGTYHMNNSEDSMVYTNATEVVTVNGGTWTLDAVGTRTNGFPCIFNAKGNNERQITVTGGTFNSNVNHQYWANEVDVPETKALKDNGDGTWTVVEAVAYVGEQWTSGDKVYTRNVGYATIAEAIAAADEGETVTLVADYSDWKMIQVGKTITIDLNGHNINRTFGGIALDITDGTVTVKGNGKISGSTTGISVAYDAALVLESGVTVEGRDGHGVDNDGALTINGATITATEYGVALYSGDEYAASLVMNSGSVSGSYGIAAYANTNVEINDGTVTGTVAGLSGEGSSHGTTFTVKGGEISSANGVGIYHPQNGNLNISGGTITGATGINMKSGTLTVTGGTIKGTGEKADYSFTGGGFNCTGDALVIESCGYPGGTPVADIKGGTFISENAAPVASYAGNNVTETVTGFISGGTFNTAPAADLAIAGYKFAQNDDSTYGVVADPAYGKVAKIGDDYFGTLAEAIANANANDTIVLLANVTEDVTVSKNLTIDGDNFEYTGKIIISGDYDVTIQNVAFVKGYIEHNGSKTTASLTVKKCSFADGGYAVTTGRIKNLVVDECTVENQSLLYAKLATSYITVKDVKINKGSYVAHLVYGSEATFENVEATNMTGYGICTQNYGAKTITLKNCSFNAPDYYALAVRDDRTTAADTFIFEGNNTMSSLYSSQYAKYVLADADATLTAPEGYTVTTTVENSMVKYADGAYKVVKVVAKIGEDKLFETFVEALNAVQDGETITVMNVEGSERKTEIDFIKDIEFTITGTSDYELPTITFQNATVNIVDANIEIGELDARQNATINVKNSTVETVGGSTDGIVKAYYNGKINIEDSAVYAHQFTVMGVVNLTGSSELTVTWQTNIYGNGLVNIGDNATLNTAAMHLTGKDYNNRDNTDADRVGKPAQITVDGGTLNIGTECISINGANYNYNSSKGINIGTIAGKKAVLDIVNGAQVNIYMADGETANIGADGTVNVDGELTVGCRKDGGTATLANSGSIVLTTVTSVVTANECGNVTTTVDGYDVTYADGKYALKVVTTVVSVTGKSLLLEDIVQVKYYIGFAPEIKSSITAAGLYVWNSESDAKTLNFSNAIWHNTEIRDEGVYEGNYEYSFRSDGIPAKEMGDLQYAVAYIVVDGETHYTAVEAYSPKTWCENKKDDPKDKYVAAALMNYGAAAQVRFDYKTDDLMNVGFDGYTFTTDMLANTIRVKGDELNGFKENGYSLVLEGTIQYKIYYAAAGLSGKSGLGIEYKIGDGEFMTIEGFEANGSSEYFVKIEGVAAKDLDELITVRPFYTENGERVYGNESQFCAETWIYNKMTSTKTDETTIKDKAIAPALGNYIVAANQRFAD